MIAFATNLLTTSRRNPSRFLEPAAVRAGVLKPRQPLCDLNFRQHLLDPPAGCVGTRLFPLCFPSSPDGRTLATYLASALHDLCGKPIPAPLKCHSVGRFLRSSGQRFALVV